MAKHIIAFSVLLCAALHVLLNCR